MIDRNANRNDEIGLPPITDADELRRLRWEYRFTRGEHRADALAEAWVAFVAGEDAARAVARFRARESRYRRRTRTNYFDDGRILRR